MKFVDPVVFGHDMQSKAAKGSNSDVTKFCDYVCKHVMSSPVATNEPAGNAQGPIYMNTGLGDPADQLSGAAGVCGAAAIILFIVGETHKNTADSRRAQKMVNRMNSDPDPTNCLLVEERKIGHKAATLSFTNFFYAHEWDMWGENFSELQRSVGIAAYVALCAAGGDQRTKLKVLLPFGDNHVTDIITAFEYLVDNCHAVRALRKRPRVYYVFRTSA